jgi:alkanesulfonate monooxygenase SsuD/methylene tetrahydromethanopterin reductase-like flavin-dependent oxidoreductase (luciferase family)
LHVDPSWAAPPGYTTEGTMRAGMQSQVGRAAANSARSRARATEMKDIVDQGYVIVGSPDEVVAQLTEVATELNVGHLMLLLQYGNMGKDLAKYNTKLFAETVMPRLRPLFAEWEDRWWPRPMDATQRAEIPAFKQGIAAE